MELLLTCKGADFSADYRNMCKRLPNGCHKHPFRVASRTEPPQDRSINLCERRLFTLKKEAATPDLNTGVSSRLTCGVQCHRSELYIEAVKVVDE